MSFVGQRVHDRPARKRHQAASSARGSYPALGGTQHDGFDRVSRTRTSVNTSRYNFNIISNADNKG